MLPIIVLLCLCLTLFGYFIYGRHVYRNEVSEFHVFAWISISLLTFVDWSNIFLSEDLIWLENLAGGIMFFGPASISYIILSNGYKIHGNNIGLCIYFSQKIKVEFRNSQDEAWLMLIGLIILIALVGTQYIGPWGKSYGLELTLAVFAVLLDIIAARHLILEIKQHPEKFEKVSWILLSLAGTIFWMLNLSIQEWWTIGSLLILEGTLVTITILASIIFFQKR